MARDYQAVIERVRGDAGGDAESRMQAVVDALWDAFEGEGVSWVGFYTEDASAGEDARLVLGPRRDKPACSPIGLHGVCGAAYRAGEVQIVRDVADLGESYVACDPRDRSEVVVPVVDARGAVTAVLDLDSFEVGAFDASDAEGLGAVLEAAGFTPARGPRAGAR